MSFFAQLIVTLGILAFALLASTVVYGTIKAIFGIRLEPHHEKIGSDLSIHLIEAHPEEAF